MKYPNFRNKTRNIFAVFKTFFINNLLTTLYNIDLWFKVKKESKSVRKGFTVFLFQLKKNQINLRTSRTRTSISFTCIVSSEKAASFQFILLDVPTHFHERFSLTCDKLNILNTERLIKKTNNIFSYILLKCCLW